jgi:hypothetical protein
VTDPTRADRAHSACHTGGIAGESGFASKTLGAHDAIEMSDLVTFRVYYADRRRRRSPKEVAMPLESSPDSPLEGVGFEISVRRGDWRARKARGVRTSKPIRY